MTMSPPVLVLVRLVSTSSQVTANCKLPPGPRSLMFAQCEVHCLQSIFLPSHNLGAIVGMFWGWSRAVVRCHI